MGMLVSGAAYRLRALTPSGMLAASAIGALIVATAGWWPGVVLIGFFVTSSVLSMLGARRSSAIEQARGKRRDAIQVFANGGIAALLALASVIGPSSAPWLIAMVAAVAGATSDTWGTEIGRLGGSNPRVITTWKSASPGTSGAISTIGTIGALAGAVAIGLIAIAGHGLGWVIPGLSAPEVLIIASVAGFAGALVDSVVGATVQASYWCPSCHKSAEQAVHSCGTPATLFRGVPWMNNDVVNALSIAAAAVMGFVGALLVG